MLKAALWLKYIQVGALSKFGLKCGATGAESTDPRRRRRGSPAMQQGHSRNTLCAGLVIDVLVCTLLTNDGHTGSHRPNGRRDKPVIWRRPRLTAAASQTDASSDMLEPRLGEHLLYTLILAVLNRYYSTPLLKSLSRTVSSIRGEHPNVHPCTPLPTATCTTPLESGLLGARRCCPRGAARGTSPYLYYVYYYVYTMYISAQDLSPL